MRTLLLAGNWKMNKTIEEAKTLTEGIVKNLKEVEDKEILLCPTFTSLTAVNELTKDTNIKIGAQNCSDKEVGAYTGEISPAMLKDVGCEYVIIGHSERRDYYKETDEFLNAKIKNAINIGLKVIFCIGETLEERENGSTFDILSNQIKYGLEKLDADLMKNLVIAYEPVWAIGTGKTATTEQAEEAHKFIREQITKLYDQDIADNTRILYGGSMKPENVQELTSCENIDGGLIGGASLKIDSFVELVNKA